MTAQNPLLTPILSILRTAEQAYSEHQLIGLLTESLQALPEPPPSKTLALFQTHFLVMNALYQLQQSFAEGGFYLLVSPLKIVLQPRLQVAANDLSLSDAEPALRDYYLDWAHFEQTGKQDVDQLLNQFWQSYVAQDKSLDSYYVLGLKVGASWSQVQQSYRRLAAEQHPDKGGDAAGFIQIREAYEILRRIEQT